MFLLFSRCTLTVLSLYSHCTPTVLSLFSHCIHAPSSLHPLHASTLRVSAGHVQGYHAANACWCSPVTTMAGIMDKVLANRAMLLPATCYFLLPATTTSTLTPPTSHPSKVDRAALAPAAYTAMQSGGAGGGSVASSDAAGGSDDSEFQVPPRVRELWEGKEFGPRGVLTATDPSTEEVGGRVGGA
jgi:hypothetical protein